MDYKHFSILFLCGLSACTLQNAQDGGMSVPEKLRQARPAASLYTTEDTEKQQNENIQTRFGNTPRPPRGPSVSRGDGADLTPDFKSSKPLKLSVEDMPLPAFINEVFSNVLGLNFFIEPVLQKKNDLVTLRVPEAQTPAQLYNLAQQVLQRYGVAIVRDGNLFQFSIAQSNQGSTEVPVLISGQALPEVPASHRPVFQVVQLNALRNIQIRGLLGQLYQFPQLKISEDPTRNAIILFGPSVQVKQALEAIRVLDQPLLRSRHSVRIGPVFVSAAQLAQHLSGILKTEGYEASIGVTGVQNPIVLLPVEETNNLFVFATSPQVLAHVREWAATLDQPGQAGDTGQGLFVYTVQNTQAAGIADTLQPLLPGIATVTPAQTPVPATPGAAKPPIVKSRLVVDKIRNLLLFQGSQQEWGTLLPVLRELDKPAKLVLVEVTIAEIMLTGKEQFGVEWILRNSAGGNHSSQFGTLGALGIVADGLNYSLVNGLGQTRALLNAFAGNNRVNVLSTPRLMVKSGESAMINVGTEVPIATSETTSSATGQTDGNSNILREIQYRRTGVTLNVKAVVHSGNRVDLEISQEVSNAAANNTSNIDSPIISNRQVETKLSLDDGGSVLLGGLISSTNSKGTAGVPGLSDIPVLGHLFRVDKEDSERTELLVLIVPYVVDSGKEAEALTETFRRRLHFERDGEETKAEALPKEKL